MFLNFLNYLLLADSGEPTGDDVEKLRSENEKLKKSYDRVVNESTTYKSRAQTAEAKLSDVEKEIAERSGDLQKQLELESNAHATTKTKLKDITTKAITNNLRIEALKLAKDAHDIDVVLNVKQHQKLLKLNEDDLSVTGVEDFIKETRKTHSYLFSKAALPTTDSTTPNSKPSNKQLTDREKYSEEIQAAKSFQELEAVKEKWAGKKTWLGNKN